MKKIISLILAVSCISCMVLGVSAYQPDEKISADAIVPRSVISLLNTTVNSSSTTLRTNQKVYLDNGEYINCWFWNTGDCNATIQVYYDEDLTEPCFNHEYTVRPGEKNAFIDYFILDRDATYLYFDITGEASAVVKGQCAIGQYTTRP